MRLAILILLLCCLRLWAGNLALAFSPSPSTNVAGYYLYGQTNGFDVAKANSAPIKLNLGTNTQVSFTTTNSTSWWFAATAYLTNGLESDFSNILPVQFPPGPTNLAVLVPQYIATLTATNWQDIGFFRVRIGPP